MISKKDAKEPESSDNFRTAHNPWNESETEGTAFPSASGDASERNRSGHG
jgi:hypothetical protein